MSPRTSTSLSTVARDTLARRVLLRGSCTRVELCDDTGLCAASVTNHTRWLLKQGFLTSRPIRVPSVNRSVDELRVNASRGTALAIHVRRDLVEAQVIQLDTHVLKEFSAPVAAATQAAVLSAVCAAVEKAREWAASEGYAIDLAGMSISGTVASEDGVVFGVDGIPQWRSCQPQQILPTLANIPVMHVWTQVMCKMIGLSSTCRREDRVGYVEFIGRSFHVASMRAGQVRYGLHGSTSAFLHVSVRDEGPICYCGRRGCLADLLESDRPIDEHLLADTFIEALRQLKVDAIGLEWQGDSAWLEKRLEDSGFTVYGISDGRGMALRGLSLLTAGALLSQRIAEDARRKAGTRSAARGRNGKRAIGRG